MGIFDRFSPRKPEPSPPAAAPPPEASAARGGVLPELAAARGKLEAKDLAGARIIYEGVLASAGDRTDVLVTISADLGINGHVREIIELIAPRYDASRHGPAAGLNLLQAYLAVREAEAAQHMLDVLFTLQRPDLRARLLGFSSAVAEMIHEQTTETAPTPPGTTISFATISKPIWFYGLEESRPQLLPKKTGPLRRVVFLQLALPQLPGLLELAAKPEEQLGRMSRAIPLWLAETFSFSAGYEASAAVGLCGGKHHVLLPEEWRTEEISRLNETSKEKFDYLVSGRLRGMNDDFEVGLKVWEMKRLRELKSFAVRWTPATTDETLRQLHEQMRTYLEWTALPRGEGLPYAAPAAPLPYLDALGASLTLFLGEKGMLSTEQVATDTTPFLRAAQANPDDIRAHLMLVTALQRLQARGVVADADARNYLREWTVTPAAQAVGLSELSAGL